MSSAFVIAVSYVESRIKCGQACGFSEPDFVLPLLFLLVFHHPSPLVFSIILTGVLPAHYNLEIFSLVLIRNVI